MEIRRLGGNKIRCALTEKEIRDMGFEIDEIIGNSEITQKFMRVVLTLVEEQADISLENVSPMVKAELLQDHSMAITFGGESDLTFRSLMEMVNQLVHQMDPGKVEEFVNLSREEKQAAVDEFLQNFHAQEEKQKAGKKRGGEPMICALRFESMEDMISMSRVCFPERVPESSLYKMEDGYYLILDFTDFSRSEMRPFAFGTAEYDSGHFSGDARIAHIREHGACIIKSEALQMLMRL